MSLRTYKKLLKERELQPEHDASEEEEEEEDSIVAQNRAPVNVFALVCNGESWCSIGAHGCATALPPCGSLAYTDRARPGS